MLTAALIVSAMMLSAHLHAPSCASQPIHALVCYAIRTHGTVWDWRFGGVYIVRCLPQCSVGQHASLTPVVLPRMCDKTRHGICFTCMLGRVHNHPKGFQQRGPCLRRALEDEAVHCACCACQCWLQFQA